MNRLLLSLFAGLLLCARLCHGQTVLSAQDAVSYALAHRPELRAANDRVTASERLRAQAGLIPNPRFLFRKEDLRPQTSPFGESSQTYWEGEQRLETSGKRGGRIAVAQQSTEESRLQSDLARRQIVLNVRESYWKAKAAQSLAALYAQDADYFRQVIEYHEVRFREGKIAEVDLLRVRLQGEQIRASAANARLDSEKTLLMLAQEMNAAPNSSWVLSEDFETLEDPKPVPAGADAVSLRAEGQLARQAITKAEAQTRLEKANGRPDLLFTGGYKRDVDIDSPVAGVQFDIPLFNRNQGAVAAAHAEEDAARETYQATRNRLSAELALAQREFEMRREQYLQTFKPLREQAIEISNISRAAYQAGGLDLLRLLDAERARVDAELSYVRALEGFHLSVAALNYAEGVDQ
ncbi:TolC family protein [Edaphobacter aggregans]|uniref:TolC family protein n=1 Tax=Edaphobacter aggregans TaxID=570835 RepID=UPI0009FEB676|nr:TolC family protein [Edaphobacter aggregans]